MTNVTDRPVDTGGCCAEGIAGVVDKARTVFTDARNSIIHAAPVEKARAGARAVDDFAHKSPWSFIGSVAVLALAVGLLLRRR